MPNHSPGTRSQTEIVKTISPVKDVPLASQEEVQDCRSRFSCSTFSTNVMPVGGEAAAIGPKTKAKQKRRDDFILQAEDDDYGWGIQMDYAFSSAWHTYQLFPTDSNEDFKFVWARYNTAWFPGYIRFCNRGVEPANPSEPATQKKILSVENSDSNTLQKNIGAGVYILKIKPILASLRQNPPDCSHFHDTLQDSLHIEIFLPATFRMTGLSWRYSTDTLIVLTSTRRSIDGQDMNPPRRTNDEKISLEKVVC